MIFLLTCKDFLKELNEFLDDETRGEVRRQLEEHLSECPNCWVICDTTRKTIEIFRGMDPYPMPEDVHTRLMHALERKIAAPKS